MDIFLFCLYLFGCLLFSLVIMAFFLNRKSKTIYLVTNHWGWSLRGIATWINFGWAFTVKKWTIETPPTQCYKWLCFCHKHPIKKSEV